MEEFATALPIGQLHPEPEAGPDGMDSRIHEVLAALDRHQCCQYMTVSQRRSPDRFARGGELARAIAKVRPARRAGARRLLIIELDTPHPLVVSLNPVALKQVLTWCSVQRCAATLAGTRQLEMP